MQINYFLEIVLNIRSILSLRALNADLFCSVIASALCAVFVAAAASADAPSAAAFASAIALSIAELFFEPHSLLKIKWLQKMAILTIF